MNSANESHQNILDRLTRLEAELEEASKPKLVELGEVSFKTVLEADVHLDNKASRILGAMAFLTAAAAAIFAKAYSASLPSDFQLRLTQGLREYVSEDRLGIAVNTVLQGVQPPSIHLLGADIVLLTFFAYMLFVLSGGVLYLAALGPALNIPIVWPQSSHSGPQSPSSGLVASDSEPLASDSGVYSLLFFRHIASFEETRWSEHWKKDSAVLESELAEDFIAEARLIAQKAKEKFVFMSVGTICFKGAIVSLIALMSTLFSFDRKFALALLLFGESTLFAAFAYESLIRSSGRARRLGFFWSAVAILLLLCIVPTCLGAGGVAFRSLSLVWATVVATCLGVQGLRGKAPFRKRKAGWGLLWFTLSISFAIALIVTNCFAL
jgi:hypothetical protein